MSFVAVFTASAMGFTLLVPIAMVLVLLAYGAPSRRAVPVKADPTESRPQRGGVDRGADVSRLAA
jgi:hypothetical protein